jgi:dTDP-glucose 4,6-dehydratase
MLLKLLVTGGLGFIGSNFIINILKNTDYEIVNIDDKLYGSNIQNLSEIEKFPNYSFVKGNIVNRHLMENLISNCDSVVNFAAESHVDRSISNPKPFLDSNINGVFSILEAIRKYDKKLVHVSTDEVYGTILTGSAKEKTRFNSSSPYAATKACSELLINAYFKTYDCNCVITRCTNNYGPMQFPEKLIPKTIGLTMENKKIPIYGNGNSVRDWIHVQDHCEAIMSVLKKGKSGESYNISASNETNVLTIVQKILSFFNRSEKNIQFGESRPGEDLRYSLDSTKIRSELGWKPKISFDTGLEETIRWYVSKKDWWKNIPQDVFGSTPWK